MSFVKISLVLEALLHTSSLRKIKVLKTNIKCMISGTPQCCCRRNVSPHCVAGDAIKRARPPEGRADPPPEKRQQRQSIEKVNEILKFSTFDPNYTTEAPREPQEARRHCRSLCAKPQWALCRERHRASGNAFFQWNFNSFMLTRSEAFGGVSRDTMGTMVSATAILG